MEKPTNEQIRQAVRDNYGAIAKKGAAGGCCAPKDASGSGCCTSGRSTAVSDQLGYTDEERSVLPDVADMTLGCGNPQAIASLQPGERVLDLGSGAGFDCFLAARAVGKTGHVVGVDMTDEMIHRARDNAAKADIDNVEFHLGEIENLPLDDNSVDVIISNCVINLSPEKPQVFKEAFRVLGPGGRLAVTDIVVTAELPEAARNDLSLYTGCVSGAATIGDLTAMLKVAGFEDVDIRPKEESRSMIREWVPGSEIHNYVVSAVITATKPSVQ